MVVGVVAQAASDRAMITAKSGIIPPEIILLHNITV
jgi:hypothetical protein